MNGYCRQFVFNQFDSNFENRVEIGFFQNGEPHGKFQIFGQNKEENDFNTMIFEGLKFCSVQKEELIINDYFTNFKSLSILSISDRNDEPE